MVVDFPESTCPMTTMLMCVFSFPMLVGYEGLAGAGGGGEGCGNAAAFLGRLRRGGGKRQTRQKNPRDGNLPAHRGGLSSHRPTFPPDHAPHSRPEVPGLVWQLCPRWDGASPPPVEASRAISGRRVQPPCSPQDATFFNVSPSTALPETPSSQGYVIGASKVPFLPRKTFLRLKAATCCLLGLSKPQGISSMSWVPWEEPWVPSPLPSRARFG